MRMSHARKVNFLININGLVTQRGLAIMLSTKIALYFQIECGLIVIKSAAKIPKASQLNHILENSVAFFRKIHLFAKPETRLHNSTEFRKRLTKSFCNKNCNNYLQKKNAILVTPKIKLIAVNLCLPAFTTFFVVFTISLRTCYIYSFFPFFWHKNIIQSFLLIKPCSTQLFPNINKKIIHQSTH